MVAPIFEPMKTNSPQDPYEAVAAPLRAKETRLVAELDAVRKSLAGIEAAREAAGFDQAMSDVVETSSKAPPVIVSEKYKGKGLEQAVVVSLETRYGYAATAKEIWGQLARANYSLLSDRPEQSVSWALRKREKKFGDVILIGNGKWGLTKWYSDEKLAEFRAARTNASGRNHEEHVEKTKAEIANAKENRLEHWGRRRRVTAEQMAKAYEIIRAGGSKLAAATAAGIEHPTFGWYWMVFEMENWRPGLPFPPARRPVPLERAPKKHAMWQSDEGFLKGNGTAVGSTVPH